MEFMSFEKDADIMYTTVKEDLGPLLEATHFFINMLAPL